MKIFVSTNWLLKNKDISNLVILDCSWYLPNTNKSGEKSYKNGHIPGSFFFDIDNISDQNTDLPHMLPSELIFKKKISKMNIDKKSTIIAYSNPDLLGSARVWWMFKYFGHNKIYILNGGLQKWKNENKPLTKKTTLIKKSKFNTNIKKEWLATYSQIKKNILVKNKIILDARNPERFKGLVSEPRKNLRKGSIPNSKNIFWKELIKLNHTFKSKKEIIKIFKKNNIKNKNIITTCGSGVSACILSLSLYYSMDIIAPVYDGSWSEYGRYK